MEEVISLAPLVGIALIFYLLLVRPGVRRRRELVAMQDSLESGDEVMLTSGVYGTVQSLEVEAVQLEIAPGVVIKVARGAIGQILTEHEYDDHDQHEHEHETDHVDESVHQPVPDDAVGSEETK